MDAVEEIKRRLNVSEVVGSYLPLKQAGANQKGLCPFHHEKTPSFMVSDAKGIWHCFGCGEGGDIFGFVMKMDGLDFKGALENLANRANVPLEDSPASAGNRRLKDRLIRINEAVTKYYQAQLDRSPAAKDYLQKRGIKTKAQGEFRLGYAPSRGDSLVKFLRSKGVNPAEMAKAGLVRTTTNRSAAPLDLFRGRLMIPLVDSLDKVVGFSGRVLDDGLPKYLNTPQTWLFDKGRFLFGLNLAKAAIRKADQVVVAEGHLDVIASHQIGVRQIIASGGTALTLSHLKQLSRLTKNVKLAFDQDQAGIVATERAIGLAQSVGVALYIVGIGTAKDPDELIKREGGLAAWQTAINKAPYAVDWLLKVLPSQYDLGSALGKKRLSDRMMSTLAHLSDPVEQDHYVQKLASLVTTSPQVIRQKLALNPRTVTPRAKAAYQAPTARDESQAIEDELLALTVTFPDTRTSLQDLGESHFSHQDRMQVFKYLKQHAGQDLTAKLPTGLHDMADYIKILLLKGEEGYQDWASLDRRIETFTLAARLQQLRIKNLRQKINQELKVAEEAGNDKRRLELLRQFRDLSRKA